MDILKYISNTVTNKNRDPVCRTSTFTFDGYFVFLPLSNETNKFERLKSGVLENCFMNQGQKNFNFSLFRQTQATYWGLKKFARVWKWKRAKMSSVDSDLYMNSLENFPDHQKTKILHHGTIYDFRLTDIINIWSKSLSQSSTFSPQPAIPKNPYVNMAFDKGHLFHFYMCMKDNARFSIPVIIEKFIKCDMDIKKFRIEAYPDLVDSAIKNHIETSSDDTLFLDCVNMVATLRKKLRGRRISLELDNHKKKEVVDKLKPFLKMHLFATLSCNPAVKYINKELVVDKLKIFFDKNPTVGRRILRVHRRTIEYAPPLFRYSNSGNGNSSSSTNEVLDDSEIDDVPDDDLMDTDEAAAADPSSASAIGLSRDSLSDDEYLSDA